MKVTTLGELRRLTADQPDETPIAVQLNYEGGHALHAVDLWPKGHVGFDGVLVHVGERLVDAVAGKS